MDASTTVLASTYLQVQLYLQVVQKYDILHKLKIILIVFITVLITSDKSEFPRYITPTDGHLQFSRSVIKSGFLITQTFYGDRGSPENFQWGPGVPRKYIVIFNTYRYEFIKFIIRFGDQGSPKAQLF